MSSSPPPVPLNGTTIAAFKGLAIATLLLTAGQLGTITTITLPSLYPTAQSAHRLAAQQFAYQYKTVKATGPPAEIITSLICSGLAYAAYIHDTNALKWKLWAGAAGAMFAVIPYTIFFMEKPSKKLLWVSEVASSASKPTGPQSTGIGVKVTPVTPQNGSPRPANGKLGLPGGKGSGKYGGITPIEEFEPFEDAVIEPEEYEQLKVTKLLKTFNGHNAVRTLGPLVAGVLGLWATLSE